MDGESDKLDELNEFVRMDIFLVSTEEDGRTNRIKDKFVVMKQRENWFCTYWEWRLDILDIFRKGQNGLDIFVVHLFEY